MAFIKLPESILLNPKISDLQLRIIANLIKYSYCDNKSYIGYDKLAAACMITKRAAIKNVKDLECAGLLRVNHRGNFSKSNEIELTLDCVLGVNEDSPLKQTQGVNQDSLGGESRITPHIDNRFKHSDLNFKKEKEKVNEDSPLEESETPDVAGVRSMPCGAQGAAENSAKEECDEAEAAKLRTLLPVLNDYFGDLMPWIQIFEVNNKIGIRVLGGRIAGVDLDVVKGFAARNNLIFSQQQFANERIIAA